MVKPKPKIYLDTSVISVYDDPRIPQRQAQTQEFWKSLKDFKVYVSEVTINEIGNIVETNKRKRLLSLTENFNILFLTDKTKELAQE